jgi:hypothetical protein
MPLETIIVDYGKQESIFEKLVPFVDKIVNIYNQKQMQEWDSEWMAMALKDIEKPSDPATLDALFSKVNPPEGYIDTKGATDFAKQALGSMTLHEQMMGITPQQPDTQFGPVQQKEIMTGGLQPKASQTPATQTGVSQKQPGKEETQLIPDKMEWEELYKFVQELPSGQVDWSNTLNLFQQRLESKKKMGDAATQFMNMILGQQQDPRAKLREDVDLTDYLMKTLYPETEEVDPIATAWDRASTLPQELRADYLREHGINIPEGAKLDYNALNTFMKDNNMKVKGTTVNSKGEPSFSLEPIEEEYELAEIATMIKEAERQGIKLSYTKDGLSMSTASTSDKPTSDYERWKNDPEGYAEFKALGKETTTDTTKPPAYGTAKTIEADLMEKVETKADFNQEIKRLKGLGIDTKTFNFPNIMKKKYDSAMEWVKYSFDKMQAGIYEDEDYNYQQVYKDSWETARRYEEEYFKETGRKLLTAPGETTGGTNQSDKTAAFIHDAKASGYTLEDYDREELKKAGVDIEKARKALGR